MDELCDAWDAWSLLQEDKLRRKIAVDARLGSSLGIKFELEKSWACKLCLKLYSGGVDIISVAW